MFTLKSIFRKQPEPSAVILVGASFDYANLPKGFFRVVTASGKESLGYNGSFLSWCVNNAVVDGGKQVTPDKPRAELPLVKLSFRNEQTGVHQSGAVTLVETDALDHDGSVSWAGAPPSGGVGYR